MSQTPHLVGRRRQQLRPRVGGMCPLLPAFVHLTLLPQDAVHRADGTVVLALVQQGPIDLPRRQVSEAFAVQHRARCRFFGFAQCAWRPAGCLDRRRCAGRLLPPIERTPRETKRSTQLLHRHRITHAFDDFFHDGAALWSVNAFSKACDSFFRAPMISSACASWARCRSFSRCSLATSWASGVGLRLRTLVAPVCNSPLARWRRHSTRWDEYNPSRRSNAPTPPASRQRSTSARMRSVYSAVKVRCVGAGRTSGSGATTGLAPFGWTTVR